MMTLIFGQDKPLYIQIYDYVKKEIHEGVLLPGSKMPSKRKLAAHMGISVNTVDAAYGQLVAEGYIEAFQRKGYYVSESESIRLNMENRVAPYISAEATESIKIDFSPTEVDSLSFPFHTWRKLLRDSLDERKPEIFKAHPAKGDISFREALAVYLRQSRGVNCEPEQIVAAAGTDLLLQFLSLLLRKDGIIAVENPVYGKTYRIFSQMGHNVKAVRVDNGGMVIDGLSGLNISAVYATPSHQFPLGISMPFGRRTQLLNTVYAQEDSYVIEDDYDSEFRYSGRTIPSMQSIDKSGRVIYIGTFSKSIAPSVRISYMVLPEKLLAKYNSELGHFPCSVSWLEQSVMTSFLNDGHFERHLNRMRKIYKQKRDCLTNALADFGEKARIFGENAGHHLLVSIDAGLNEAEMCVIALKYGVKVYGISEYFIGGIPQDYKSTILLGYGGLDEQRILEGVGILRDKYLGASNSYEITHIATPQ